MEIPCLNKVTIPYLTIPKRPRLNDPLSWERYKRARNHANIDIRKAKRKYFNDNLDGNKQNPKAIWNLINDLYYRKLDKLRSVSEIKIGEQIITNTTEIAEQFNLYFSNIRWVHTRPSSALQVHLSSRVLVTYLKCT